MELLLTMTHRVTSRLDVFEKLEYFNGFFFNYTIFQSMLEIFVEV